MIGGGVSISTTFAVDANRLDVSARQVLLQAINELSLKPIPSNVDLLQAEPPIYRLKLRLVTLTYCIPTECPRLVFLTVRDSKHILQDGEKLEPDVFGTAELIAMSILGTSSPQNLG